MHFFHHSDGKSEGEKDQELKVRKKGAKGSKGGETGSFRLKGRRRKEYTVLVISFIHDIVANRGIISFCYKLLYYAV